MKRITTLALVLLLSACASVGGNTKGEKQKLIQKMEQETLAELYKQQPAAKKEISASKAYGVFSNININLLIIAAGNGYGLVREKSQSPLYMKMGEAGIGLGLGGKDFKLVLIFNDAQTLKDFKAGKFAFAGNADAVAKSGEKGGGAGAEGIANKIKVYQLTNAGLALQATVKGTKYWVDEELN